MGCMMETEIKVSCTSDDVSLKKSTAVDNGVSLALLNVINDGGSSDNCRSSWHGWKVSGVW